MAEEIMHKRIERERRDTAPMGGSWSKSRGSWTVLREFRDYARGRQRATLNQDQIRIMQTVLKHDFSDNVLRQILWTHANRLRVARFDVEDTAVLDFLRDTWVRNQFPDLFADLIFATLRDGSHAVSLDWKASDDTDNPYGGRVRLTRERWWDGRDGVFVMYGDDALPAYAVKEWLPLDEKVRKRRNVYFSDIIYRFVWDGGEWAGYTVPGEEGLEPVNDLGVRTPGVVPWVKRDGRPLGIPIVHFANGSDDDSFYGTSLLDGGSLAFQDQINAIQHDITAAAMMNGSPQTWSRGFDLETDPSDPTRRVAITTGPGQHHHNDSPLAEWGTLEPGSLSELKGAYITKLEAVCRMTNTPLHALTGVWPSGEAIFRAEMPLNGSTRKLGESVGPSSSTVMHRATEIENAYGDVALDESALIQTVFEPAEQRDELARWAVADKASAHVSSQEILRIVGYPPDRIEAIMKEIADAKAESVSMAQSAFSRPADLDALQRAAGQSLDDKGAE